MSKRALQLLVVGVLVALAFALRGRGGLPPTPEAAVSAFFDAAGRGDHKAYVALTSGELRKSLLASRAQLGPPAFRESLARSAAGLKGIAVTRGSAATAGRVALDVELVFADRNERQTITLAPRGRGWVIVEMGGARTAKPPIPYGTPVLGKE